MTDPETEKEIVLGNKQLLSLFFVVVALCGVFFAMGYMIGRNTSKAQIGLVDSAPSALSNATETAGQTAPRESAPAPQPASPAATAESSAEQGPPVTGTQPAHDVPDARAAAPSASTATEPEPGATYLQVTALRRDDATSLVKSLREQNFPALLAESSKPDLFRVLVGPYHQVSQVAEAKSRLKALGFANAFVQK